MGRNHLRAIADSSTVRVTAIAEPVETARASLPQTDAAVYPDLDSMISAGGVCRGGGGWRPALLPPPPGRARGRRGVDARGPPPPPPRQPPPPRSSSRG